MLDKVFQESVPDQQAFDHLLLDENYSMKDQ